MLGVRLYLGRRMWEVILQKSVKKGFSRSDGYVDCGDSNDGNVCFGC